MLSDTQFVAGAVARRGETEVYFHTNSKVSAVDQVVSCALHADIRIPMLFCFLARDSFLLALLRTAADQRCQLLRGSRIRRFLQTFWRSDTRLLVTRVTVYSFFFFRMSLCFSHNQWFVPRVFVRQNMSTCTLQMSLSVVFDQV